jgi:hypothetical protein
MLRTVLSITLIPFLLQTITACTAVQSKVVKSTTPDGIPYFLPRRPFAITISRPVGGGPPSIAVTPGNAEPDLAKEFVLTQGNNLLAQNEFNITVGRNGLLMSSQSTATSQVAAIVQNMAASAGMFAAPLSAAGAKPLSVQSQSSSNAFSTILALDGANALPPGPQIACPLAGTSFQYFVYPEGRFDPNYPLSFDCGGDGIYTVLWQRSDGPPPDKYHYSGDNSNVNQSHKVSGLFFRHELPYLVTIEGANGSGLRQIDLPLTTIILAGLRPLSLVHHHAV